MGSCFSTSEPTPLGPGSFLALNLAVLFMFPSKETVDYGSMATHRQVITYSVVQRIGDTYLFFTYISTFVLTANKGLGHYTGVFSGPLRVWISCGSEEVCEIPDA